MAAKLRERRDRDARPHETRSSPTASMDPSARARPEQPEQRDSGEEAADVGPPGDAAGGVVEAQRLRAAPDLQQEPQAQVDEGRELEEERHAEEREDRD